MNIQRFNDFFTEKPKDEIGSLRETISNLERELKKANMIISRSQDKQDVSALIEENANLKKTISQMTIESQDQQEALHQSLKDLYEENRKLHSEIENKTTILNEKEIKLKSLELFIQQNMSDNSKDTKQQKEIEITEDHVSKDQEKEHFSNEKLEEFSSKILEKIHQIIHTNLETHFEKELEKKIQKKIQKNKTLINQKNHSQSEEKEETHHPNNIETLTENLEIQELTNENEKKTFDQNMELNETETQQEVTSSTQKKKKNKRRKSKKKQLVDSELKTQEEKSPEIIKNEDEQINQVRLNEEEENTTNPPQYQEKDNQQEPEEQQEDKENEKEIEKEQEKEKANDETENNQENQIESKEEDEKKERKIEKYRQNLIENNKLVIEKQLTQISSQILEAINPELHEYLKMQVKLNKQQRSDTDSEELLQKIKLLNEKYNNLWTEFEKSNADYQTQIEKLKISEKKTKEEREAIELKHTQTVRTLMEENTNQLKRLEQFESLKKEEIRKLKQDHFNEIESLQKDLELFQTDSVTTMKKLSQQSLELDSLREELRKRDSQLSSSNNLQSQFDELLIENRKLKNQISGEEKKKELLISHLEESKTTLINMEERVREQENFAKLKSEQTRTLRESVNNLKAEIEEKDKLILELNSQTELIEKLTKDYQDLDTQFETTKREKKQSESLRKELADHIELLEKENEQMKQKISKLESEIEDLKSKKDKLEEEVEKYKQEEVKWTESNQKLEETNLSLQSELKEEKSNLEANMSELNKYKEQTNELNERITNLQNMKHDLENSKNDEIEKLHEELKKIKEEAHMEKAITEKKTARQIKELQNELQKERNRKKSPNTSRNNSPRGSHDTIHPISSTISTSSPVKKLGTDHHHGDQLQEENSLLLSQLGVSQQEKASIKEKLSLIEDRVRVLERELDKKSEVITHLISKLPLGGGRATPLMEQNKHDRMSEKGFMGSLFRSNTNSSDKVTSELYSKMESVLQETLLKNIQLQNDIATLGDEVSQLLQENKTLKENK